MKLRLTGFVLAIGLLVSLIVWAAVASWQRVDESRARLAAVQSESFHIASYLQQHILDLSERLLRFTFHPDSNDVAAFESEWTTLDRWIDGQHLTSPAEQRILDQINAAYDDYHEAAQRIHRRLTSGTSASFPTAEVSRFDRETARLLDLSYQLAEAHRRSLIPSLAGTDNSLNYLRGLLLGALFLLLGFGGWLAVIVYRQLLAPLQIRLVQSQALLARQEKLASLGVLAAGVAHEIRNPLTAIKAWLFMHQRQLRVGTQQHSDAEVIASEIDRLEHIVSDFLLFARPSPPAWQVVPADDPLRAVQQLLAPELNKSGIDFRFEPSAPAWIRIDPNQIKQVLINLVQNAADAAGQGGTVTIRSRLARRRLNERETDVVILEVIDTGRGIPPEAEKRLFDPFFTTKENGTGLGLPIAARIVETHGGALQYQTQMNRGTTFGIVLPRVEHHENASSAH